MNMSLKLAVGGPNGSACDVRWGVWMMLWLVYICSCGADAMDPNLRGAPQPPQQPSQLQQHRQHQHHFPTLQDLMLEDHAVDAAAVPPELAQAARMVAKQIVREQLASMAPSVQPDDGEGEFALWLRKFMDLPSMPSWSMAASSSSSRATNGAINEDHDRRWNDDEEEDTNGADDQAVNEGNDDDGDDDDEAVDEQDIDQAKQLKDEETEFLMDLLGPEVSLESSSALWMELSSPLMEFALDTFREWQYARTQQAQTRATTRQVTGSGSLNGSLGSLEPEMDALEVVAMVVGSDNTTQAEIVVTVTDEGSRNGVEDLVIEEDIFVNPPSGQESVISVGSGSTDLEDDVPQDVIVIEELTPVEVQRLTTMAPTASVAQAPSHTPSLLRRQPEDENHHDQQQPLLDPVLAEDFHPRDWDRSEQGSHLRREQQHVQEENQANKANLWPQHDHYYHHHPQQVGYSEAFGMTILSCLSVVGMLMVLIVWKKARRVRRTDQPPHQQPYRQDSMFGRREEVLTGSRMFQFLGTEQDGYRAL